MIGICPHCKISLKEPPFKGRVLNEVMIVMAYRYKLDKKIPIRAIEKLGYCEICNAKLEDLRKQKKIVV